VSYHPDTVAVTAGRPTGAGAPLNTAITPASTYRADGDLVYGRDGNPGWLALEEAIGALEGGNAVAFASGLAASAAILDDLPLGALVLSQRSLYFGVLEQLQERAAQQRIRVEFADSLTPRTIAASGGPALVWAESPSNPLMDLTDLGAVATAATAAGARLCVDNTFATPVLQTPLGLGADVVLHSATKFIGGHSDLLLGLVVTRDADEVGRLRARRSASGSTPGALESFLALRGLRTLPVRMARAQASARILADRLASHPAVSRVRYPGLADHPGREVVERQMRGPGAMLAFETTGDADTADAVCAAARLIVSTTSLGGVETSMERRAQYASEREMGTPETLIRISVGLENPEDLWGDLEHALEGAPATEQHPRR
jgi:cystathionine gamma-synthase